MLELLGSVGPSILSGIFGAFGAKSQMKNQMKLMREQAALAEQYRVKPAQVRAEALAGGFNPLTVLRSGGMSSPNVGGAPAAPLSSMSAIAEAIGSAGNALARYDPMERQTRELENELLRKQIESADRALQKQTGPGQLGAVPVVRQVTVSPTRRSASRPPLASISTPKGPTYTPGKDSPFVTTDDPDSPLKKKLNPARVDFDVTDATKDNRYPVEPLDPTYIRTYGQGFGEEVPGWVNVWEDAVRVESNVRQGMPMYMPAPSDLLKGYRALDAYKKIGSTRLKQAFEPYVSPEEFRARNRKRAGQPFLPIR